MCCNLRCLFFFFALSANLSYGSVAMLGAVSNSKALPSGMRVGSGKAIIEITALRDDVVRIRIAPNGQLAEDASWAALPSARQEKVNVTAASDAAAVGFTTKFLRVEVERATAHRSEGFAREYLARRRPWLASGVSRFSLPHL